MVDTVKRHWYTDGVVERHEVKEMENASLKVVIEKLESLFSKFNEQFYEGKIQKPVITVSPDTTKGAYG